MPSVPEQRRGNRFRSNRVAARIRVLRIGEEVAAGGGEARLEIEAAESCLAADLEQAPLRGEVGIRPPDLVALGEDRDEETELLLGWRAREVRVSRAEPVPVGGLRIMVEAEVHLLDQPRDPAPGLGTGSARLTRSEEH